MFKKSEEENAEKTESKTSFEDIKIEPKYAATRVWIIALYSLLLFKGKLFAESCTIFAFTYYRFVHYNFDTGLGFYLFRIPCWIFNKIFH